MRAVSLLFGLSLAISLVALAPTGAAAYGRNCLKESPVNHDDTCYGTQHNGCDDVKYPRCEQHCAGAVIDPKLPGVWYANSLCVPGLKAA